MGAPPRSESSSMLSTWEAAWTRSSCSRVAAGASISSIPSQSRSDIASSIALIRRRLPGGRWVSCSTELGCRQYSPAIAGTLGFSSPMTPDGPLDVVVVGGGAAGLYSALTAADAGSRVAMVSRKPLSESSSFWAQGGLAAAIGPDDSPEQHVEDTVAAGRGACRRSAAVLLANEAPGVVWELQRLGIHCDLLPDESLSLALEGGHSRRRVVHAGGAATGRRITERLAELAGRAERIDVIEKTSAVALWSDGGRCYGVITDAGSM